MNIDENKEVDDNIIDSTDINEMENSDINEAAVSKIDNNLDFEVDQNKELNEDNVLTQDADMSDESEHPDNNEESEITSDDNNDKYEEPVSGVSEQGLEENTLENDDDVLDTSNLSINEIKRIIEAFLFISDKPLTPQRIKKLLGAFDVKTIKNLIAELKDEYDNEERSFHIIEIADGFQIYTREKYFPWINKMILTKSEKKLSNALLETLAIIAYKQPITRVEIESIRGVGVSYILKNLAEKKLIKIVGKKEGIGKSILYGTTREFLEYFGLRNIKELPQLNELKELMNSDKNERYVSENQEHENIDNEIENLEEQEFIEEELIEND